MHTIRPEIWQETLKNNNAHFRTCNMSRKLKKKVENAKCTLFDLECGKKT